MSQFLRTPWTVASIVTAIAVLSACGKTQQAAAPAAADKPAPAPVAIVNGAPISRTEFDIYVKGLLQGKQQELTPEQKDQVLDEMIGMQLLSAQADKEGLEKDPDIAAQLDVLRMRVLADAASQKYLKGQEPTDAELHAEYETALAAMDKTEYHARHILVANKDQADDIDEENQRRREIRRSREGSIHRRLQGKRRGSWLVHAGAHGEAVRRCR